LSLATLVAAILVVSFCILLAGIIFAALTAKNDPEAGVWIEHHEVPANYTASAVNVRLNGVNRRNGPRQPATA
jgi:hypothetical protein